MTPFLGQKSDLIYRTTFKEVVVERSKIRAGVNAFDDFFAYKEGECVIFYDRICDHNGGKLINKASDACIVRCPLHGWELDVTTGHYKNVSLKKDALKSTLNGDAYTVYMPERVLDWTYSTQKRTTKLNFINHACFVIEVGEHLRFATDPWVLGSAFCDGWWLSEPSPIDAIEQIASCDFVYISHNHPDHLHAATLKLLARDTTFVVPKFTSGSVTSFLKDIGFHDIHECELNTVYDCNVDDFKFSVLKSGDFRDDSGIIFSYGSSVVVMCVDSNALNHYALPQDIALLATSFAGGASGFPLCFGNYGEDEKDRLVVRNKNALLHSIRKYVDVTNPKYYVPYAGYFTEDEARDPYIFQRNKKNKVQDVAKFLNGATELIDPTKSRQITLSGSDVFCENTAIFNDTSEDRSATLEVKSTTYGDITDAEILAYFQGANYTDTILLYLNLCADDFTPLDRVFQVDFTGKKINVQKVDRRPHLDQIKIDDGLNRLMIDIRVTALGEIVRDYKPWEDFMIGFQARVERWPNTYNSGLWYYFTNVYIVEHARRATYDCGQVCERLNQEIGS